MPDRWPIMWNGHLVGWIDSPKIDMPHYYGHWVATQSDESVGFLTALREAIDEESGLEVVIADKLRGVIYVHPEDNEGEIDVRWRSNLQ